MVKNDELSTRQKRMITALITSKNIGEACGKSGVSRSTLARWMLQNMFLKALIVAEQGAISEASRSLIAGQEDALETLRLLMTSGESEMVKRQAANDWLNHLFKYRELVDIEIRLARLEEVQSGNKSKNK